MKKTSFFLFALSLVVMLFSCDPESRSEYWIENNSTSEIYVMYNHRDSVETQCKNLKSGEEFLLLEYSYMGGISDTGIDDLFFEFDYLDIFSDTTNNILVIKDWTKRNEWKYEEKVTSKITDSGYNIYTFLITTEDILDLTK